jgi:AraC family transcriptional activator of pobA
VTGWLVAANSIVISKALTTFFDEQTRIVPLSVDYLLAERLTHTVKALQASCKLVDRSFSKAIIFHLVSAYAGFITDAYRTADARYSGKTGRPFDITRSFLKMVRENHTELKRPAHYADKLAISTVYLNECVKFVTGMAVTHWVIQERILEAKRLLFHSQLSIKEIALRLGYADDAYFLESFRK